MKLRHQKLAIIVLVLIVIAAIVALVLNALNSNIALYISPSEVKDGKYPDDKMFRIGGLVKENSLQRQADGVSVNFIVTDMQNEVKVVYKGILPDLFSEGKGVVAQGKIDQHKNFIAQEVLAKHDENYMPPEAAKALQEAHAEGIKTKYKENTENTENTENK